MEEGRGGVRRPGPLPAWKAAALRGARNEGVEVREDGHASMLADGSCTPIGTATEGVQLHWLCGCGVHSRYCTPHTLSSPLDLVCRFCESAAGLKAAGVSPASSHERRFMQCMGSAGLGRQLRPEVLLPFWHGRIDFVHFPSRVLVQVDGEHHFQRRLFGVPAGSHRSCDADMCLASWRAGFVLVRVHHLDLGPPGAATALVAQTVRAATADLAGPLLVLSPSYGLSHPTARSGALARQTALLHTIDQRLRDAGFSAAFYSDRRRCIWIGPHPTHTPQPPTLNPLSGSG